MNLLAWLATCVSVLAFLFYYRQGEVLLYGDAIAHINIARRVFDSQTPGLLQLGTVWLPLPHLLMIPFILSREMWRSGAGGSIPSMAGYVFAVIGIFRLTRTALTRSQPDRCARFAAWTAAIVFAANPNLVYMQSTAMGESLYLAFFLWSVVFFIDWVRGSNSLTKCALCLAAACLTRYDGWFLSVAMTIAVIAIWLQRRRQDPDRKRPLKLERAAIPGATNPNAVSAVQFILIAAAAPALWLAYNAAVYRNPLEFANGPYSAKAIEQRTQTAGNPGHPGSGNPIVAALYFLKSAEGDVAQNEWLQRAWMLLALAALLVITTRPRRSSSPPSVQPPANSQVSRVQTADLTSSWMDASALPLLFLLVPLPFYALSIAYSGVPIFIPEWWPFTHYNTRYGLQLLPALAVAPAVLACVALRTETIKSRARLAIILTLFVVVAASYGSILQSTPVCLKEAQVNMRTRNQLQMELARWIEKLPPRSTLLMYSGDHVGALERAAFPLKRTINEGNHRVWKQPADSEGLWERALADPARYADYVLAFDGDPVWQAVHQKHLHELIELHITGQPRAVLYAAR